VATIFGYIKYESSRETWQCKSTHNDGVVCVRRVVVVVVVVIVECQLSNCRVVNGEKPVA